MTIAIKIPIAIAVVFLWIGFICAISFMEAWLKFRAPGVDLSLGLGIGRIVFNALNKVEWFFALAILFSFFISKNNFLAIQNLAFYIPFFVLIIQTIWVLPALDLRAQMYIDNKTVAPSYLHFYYVIMEIIKVGCLFIYGIKLFKI